LGLGDGGSQSDGRNPKGRAIKQDLAKRCGFTDEELDFIINYDIKYRMGRGADD
jgi:hypothetical protein